MQLSSRVRRSPITSCRSTTALSSKVNSKPAGSPDLMVGRKSLTLYPGPTSMSRMSSRTAAYEWARIIAAADRCGGASSDGPKSAKLSTYAIRATITVVTINVVQSVILWSVKVTLNSSTLRSNSVITAHSLLHRSRRPASRRTVDCLSHVHRFEHLMNKSDDALSVVTRYFPSVRLSALVAAHRRRSSACRRGMRKQTAPLRALGERIPRAGLSASWPYPCTPSARGGRRSGFLSGSPLCRPGRRKCRHAGRMSRRNN